MVEAGVGRRQTPPTRCPLSPSSVAAASRFSSDLDARFRLRSRARSAADTVDGRLGVRRRARALAADVKRLGPLYARRTAAFFRSEAGGPTLIAILFVLAATGLLGRVLRFALLLWWLAPMLLLPLAAADARRAADAQQREAARTAARAKWGPAAAAAEWFGGAARGGRPGGAKGGASGSEDAIDVEWQSLD